MPGTGVLKHVWQVCKRALAYDSTCMHLYIFPETEGISNLALLKNRIQIVYVSIGFQGDGNLVVLKNPAKHVPQALFALLAIEEFAHSALT